MNLKKPLQKNVNLCNFIEFSVRSLDNFLNLLCDSTRSSIGSSQQHEKKLFFFLLGPCKKNNIKPRMNVQKTLFLLVSYLSHQFAYFSFSFQCSMTYMSWRFPLLCMKICLCAGRKELTWIMSSFLDYTRKSLFRMNRWGRERERENFTCWIWGNWLNYFCLWNFFYLYETMGRVECNWILWIALCRDELYACIELLRILCFWGHIDRCKVHGNLWKMNVDVAHVAYETFEMYLKGK